MNPSMKVDKIKYTKGIGTLNQAQMLEFLNDDLRLDLLNSLDIELIVAIAAAYKSKNLKTLAVLLKKGKL